MAKTSAHIPDNKSSGQMPYHKRFISWGYNFLAALVLLTTMVGFNLSDVQHAYAHTSTYKANPFSSCATLNNDVLNLVGRASATAINLASDAKTLAVTYSGTAINPIHPQLQAADNLTAERPNVVTESTDLTQYDGYYRQFCQADPNATTIANDLTDAHSNIVGSQNVVSTYGTAAATDENFSDNFNWCDPANASTPSVQPSIFASVAQLLAPPAPPLVVTISQRSYPEATGHIQRAIARGAASILTIDRPGCSTRRRASLRPYPSNSNLGDRDEYPPAVAAEGGAGASVEYIRMGDNRGAGATMGAQLRGKPDGTKFTIKIVP